MGHNLSCSVQGQFGVISCTCLTVACNSRTAGHSAKRIEIWDLVILGLHIWGTIYVVLEVILWSFGAFVTKWPKTRK